jgi:glycosyltransferase involved in cell wall biosynthesis
MKFINKTNNSVYLEDVLISIPYKNEEIQEIETETVKKSFAFQQMVALGAFEVIEVSSDRLERNLAKISKSLIQKEEVDIERKESGSTPEIVIRGHFYESTGYAKVNRNLALNLKISGYKTEIYPISTRNSTMNEVESRMLSYLKSPVGKDHIFIDSVIPTHSKIEKNNYSVLYTTAETNKVSKDFVEIANKYSELWTTSEFSKNAFLKSGYNKNIKIVKPIINTALYNESELRYNFRPNAKSFVFLSVLTWGYRKGSDALIRSFCSAFTNNDDVSLVLLLSEKSESRKNIAKNQIEQIKSEFINPPQIFCCFKNIPEYILPSFYRSCNAFVLPSRGEGFGIPYCEASLCGLPVISTRYGGQLDFLNDKNSTLVDIDCMEISKCGDTGIHYWDGYEFPSLKTKHFISRMAFSMRNVFENYEEKCN